MRLILLLGILLLAGVTAAASLPRAFERAHGAALLLETPNGECSGTAVGPHAILTARHCYHGEPVITANGKPCEVVKGRDDGNDHALLIVRGCGPFLARVKHGEPPRQGDEVFIFGNPIYFRDQLRVGLTTGTGIVEVAGMPLSKTQPFILFDLEIGPGDSGAGIFSDRGELVGVVSVTTEKRYPFHPAGAWPLQFKPEDWAEAAK